MNQTVIASEETTKKSRKKKTKPEAYIFIREISMWIIFFFQMHDIRYILSSNRMVFYSYQSHVKQKFKFSEYCVSVR